ncbi:MAG: hypothetical protein AB7K09_23720 [Planctomycetota bacterium]
MPTASNIDAAEWARRLDTTDETIRTAIELVEERTRGTTYAEYRRAVDAAVEVLVQGFGFSERQTPDVRRFVTTVAIAPPRPGAADRLAGHSRREAAGKRLLFLLVVLPVLLTMVGGAIGLAVNGMKGLVGVMATVYMCALLVGVVVLRIGRMVRTIKPAESNDLDSPEWTAQRQGTRRLPTRPSR